MDEAYELSRSVRDARFLYIRNYLPHQSWNQPERYSDAADMRREISDMAVAGTLSAAQLTYAGPDKPLEGLYDTHADPHQLKNLADQPQYHEQLQRMRRACRRWSLQTGDLGFLPEALIAEEAEGLTPWELRHDAERYPIEQVLDAADLVGRTGEFTRQLELLHDPNAAVRFWAVVGVRTNRQRAAEVVEAVNQLLQDPAAIVRIEAAVALVQQGDARALQVLARELRSENLNVALLAARNLQLLGDRAAPVAAVMRETLADASAREGQHPLYMFIRFSLEAALENRDRQQQ